MAGFPQAPDPYGATYPRAPVNGPYPEQQPTMTLQQLQELAFGIARAMGTRQPPTTPVGFDHTEGQASPEAMGYTARPDGMGYARTTQYGGTAPEPPDFKYAAQQSDPFSSDAALASADRSQLPFSAADAVRIAPQLFGAPSPPQQMAGPQLPSGPFSEGTAAPPKAMPSGPFSEGTAANQQFAQQAPQVAMAPPQSPGLGGFLSQYLRPDPFEETPFGANYGSPQQPSQQQAPQTFQELFQQMAGPPVPPMYQPRNPGAAGVQAAMGGGGGVTQKYTGPFGGNNGVPAPGGSGPVSQQLEPYLAAEGAEAGMAELGRNPRQMQEYWASNDNTSPDPELNRPEEGQSSIDKHVRARSQGGPYNAAAADYANSLPDRRRAYQQEITRRMEGKPIMADYTTPQEPMSPELESKADQMLAMMKKGFDPTYLSPEGAKVYDRIKNKPTMGNSSTVRDGRFARGGWRQQEIAADRAEEKARRMDNSRMAKAQRSGNPVQYFLSRAMGGMGQDGQELQPWMLTAAGVGGAGDLQKSRDDDPAIIEHKGAVAGLVAAQSKGDPVAIEAAKQQLEAARNNLAQRRPAAGRMPTAPMANPINRTEIAAAASNPTLPSIDAIGVLQRNGANMDDAGLLGLYGQVKAQLPPEKIQARINEIAKILDNHDAGTVGRRLLWRKLKPQEESELRLQGDFLRRLYRVTTASAHKEPPVYVNTPPDYRSLEMGMNPAAAWLGGR